MTEAEKGVLVRRYSSGDLSAMALRKALGNITYGDVILELRARGLPLPRAPQAGRESQLQRLEALLFPDAT